MDDIIDDKIMGTMFSSYLMLKVSKMEVKVKINFIYSLVNNTFNLWTPPYNCKAKFDQPNY